MRIIPALIALSALAFSQTAAAAAPTLAPITFSPEFQTTLEDDIGVREGDVLRNTVANAVNSALARHGVNAMSGAPVTIEIAILDADPNRPTMQQISHQPSIVFGSSYSVGGAELHAMLRGAGGEVLSEVSHRQYNYNIDEYLGPPATWAEARRAIARFADKVADAYVVQTNAR